MRRMMTAALAAMMLVGVSGSAAWAVEATAVSAEKEALIRRMFRATNVEKTIDSTLASMLPIIAAQAARRAPAAKTEDQAVMVEIIREVIRDFAPKMLDAMVPVYADTFTVEELQGVVTFYEGPVGQAVIAKTPKLAPRSAELVQQLLPEVTVQVAIRLCARIGCDQKPVAAPKPS